VTAPDARTVIGEAIWNGRRLSAHPRKADRVLDALCPPGEMRVVDRRGDTPVLHSLEPYSYRCVWNGCQYHNCDGIHYEGTKRAPTAVEVESWCLSPVGNPEPGGGA
jgi:hypothetical protein